MMISVIKKYKIPYLLYADGDPLSFHTHRLNNIRRIFSDENGNEYIYLCESNKIYFYEKV